MTHYAGLPSVGNCAAPGVAGLLFVATSISGGTYGQTIKHCWPFIGALIFTLLLVLVFPALSTWIPNTFLR